MADKDFSRYRFRGVRGALVLATPLVCAFLTAAQAQIRTDGTLGRPAVGLTGPSFLITEALGRLAGSNLFYSFQVFNVGNAESATFITTTAGLTNLISRVTGGSPSQINGLVSVQSTNAAPNFFFINPAGVVLGQGAQINVPAGFNVSTANYLKFPDGNFYADPKAVSTLSSAAPEAFGFLGTTRAAVTINDNATIGTANTPFQIVAGDVTVDNAMLQNQAGDVRVIAVGGGAAEIGLTGTSTLASGTLTLSNGGSLNTMSAGAIPAGNITVAAGTIGISDVGSRIYSTTPVGATAGAGNIDVLATQDLSIVNGGEINSSTFAKGNAGSVKVSAGGITIDSQGRIFSQAESNSSGKAGEVNVRATRNLSVVDGGSISSSTFSSGDAGTLTVSAGSIIIDSQGNTDLPTGIFSPAGRGSSGNAGTINVTATGNLSVLNGGQINSSTFSSGDAGAVTVSAGSIIIDSQGGIFSEALPRSSGNAGTINVTAPGNLSVVNGGFISSSTFSSGDAGTLIVNAGGITIDSQGNTLSPTGIFSNAFSGSSGNAGTINVTATGNLSVLNGGEINSSTFSSGDAGAVTVSAGSIIIDRQGNTHFRTGIFSDAISGSGNAGTIRTAAGNLLVVNGGSISSSTFSSGNAGTIIVNTGGITIDSQGNTLSPTGIFSTAASGSGNAGTINVTATGNLSVLNGGEINSSTFSSGDAGALTVSAGSIIIDSQGNTHLPTGIFSEAFSGSSGQTGKVVVKGTSAITLSNGGKFSIINSARVDAPGSIVPTLLTVSAPQISLSNGGQITAASSQNIAASNIQVDFGSRLSLADSAITTSAQDGNGGAIRITGSGGVLSLHNAQITTSVAGLSGNGGDINVRANALVMDTGFIQANTAAANASGGKVTIEVDALLPSGSTLFVGGAKPNAFAPGVFGFNVIQAAAPTGVSGTIQISTPVLDLIGSISALPAEFLDSGGLGRSPCAIVGGSSLSEVGRGGLPPRAGDLLWIDPVIEVPATPPAGAPGSGMVVPPYRSAGSNVRFKTNPCWS